MRKYLSAVTKDLTVDNWEEKIDLNQLSLDDMTDLLGDLKALEKLGKNAGGYLKEAVKARMPEDEYDGPHYHLVRAHRIRSGGLNEAKLVEDMGEEWVEGYRQPPIEYEELRVTRKEPE
jgi:hypothetical protein